MPSIYVLYNYTVRSVYEGHSRESENVTFMSSCPTDQNKMHYSLMGI